MPLGETLSVPVRKKTGVDPAVVAHGERAAAKEDDLHRVRMTALHTDHVIVVASVRRRLGTCSHLGYVNSNSSLLHDAPASSIRDSIFADPLRQRFNITLTPEVNGVRPIRHI